MSRTRFWIAITATAVVAAGVAHAQDIIRVEDGDTFPLGDHWFEITYAGAWATTPSA